MQNLCSAFCMLCSWSYITNRKSVLGVLFWTLISFHFPTWYGLASLLWLCTYSFVHINLNVTNRWSGQHYFVFCTATFLVNNILSSIDVFIPDESARTKPMDKSTTWASLFISSLYTQLCQHCTLLSYDSIISTGFLVYCELLRFYGSAKHINFFEVCTSRL